MAGFNASIDRYRELLSEVDGGHLNLPNDNFDVGAATRAGQYKLTDSAYAKLLHKLDGHHADLSQVLRSDLLGFYQDLSLPIETKTHESEWARLQEELSHLKAINRDLAGPSSRASAAAGVPLAK
jgi:hypothetical protein